MINPTIKSLILDMDGVLWKADSPIGDLDTTFSRISSKGYKFAFATNNGIRTPLQYVQRLKDFGVRAEEWQVVTSATCVASMIRKDIPLGSPIYVIGEDGILEAVSRQGFIPVSIEESSLAKAVVVGLDRNITFSKMAEAALLVRKGIPFYATNPDLTFPTPRGEIPGAGAWISVIERATGITPVYAGKPSAEIIKIARERLGTMPDQTLVVGDRLETDILAGQSAGCKVALVLSGVSTLAQAANWLPKIDYIAEDLSVLIG